MRRFILLKKRNTLPFECRHQRSKGARSFRGQNIFEPGHPDAIFSSEKLTAFFSRRLHRWDCFNVKIKQIKRLAVRYGKLFIFCSHYYRCKAKQQAGRSQGGGASSRIIWPGAPCCSAATVSFTKVKYGIDISDLQICRYEVKTVMSWKHVQCLSKFDSQVKCCNKALLRSVVRPYSFIHIFTSALHLHTFVPTRKYSRVYGLCIGDSSFCVGKSNGLYATAGNCSAYYRCVDESTFIHPCDEGDIFDDIRRRCVPPQVVSEERQAQCQTGYSDSIISAYFMTYFRALISSIVSRV